MFNTQVVSIQNRTRINEKLTGLFFVMASASAIVGLLLYGPALAEENSFATVAEHSSQISLGAFFELLLVCSNIGTGIMLFPYLRLFNERLGIAYLCFRFLEAVLIIVGIVSVLALVNLASFYGSSENLVLLNFQGEAALLRAIHEWTFILGPHFVLGINTFVYSYVFLKSGVVPKSLSLVGVSGAVLIFAAAVLELFSVIQVNSPLLIAMALPIAFYEMILAGWLIVRGYKITHVEIWA